MTDGAKIEGSVRAEMKCDKSETNQIAMNCPFVRRWLPEDVYLTTFPCLAESRMDFRLQLGRSLGQLDQAFRFQNACSSFCSRSTNIPLRWRQNAKLCGSCKLFEHSWNISLRKPSFEISLLLSELLFSSPRKMTFLCWIRIQQVASLCQLTKAES